jgi:hypothetical protein
MPAAKVIAESARRREGKKIGARRCSAERVAPRKCALALMNEPGRSARSNGSGA